MVASFQQSTKFKTLVTDSGKKNEMAEDISHSVLFWNSNFLTWINPWHRGHSICQSFSYEKYPT